MNKKLLNEAKRRDANIAPTVISTEMCRVFGYLNSVYCVPESLGFFDDDQWKENKLTDNPLVFTQPFTSEVYETARLLDSPMLKNVEGVTNQIYFAGKIFSVPQSIGSLTIDDWREGKVARLPGVSVQKCDEETPHLIYTNDANIIESNGLIYVLPHWLGEVTLDMWRDNLIKDLRGVFSRTDIRPKRNFREKNIIDLSISRKNAKTIEYPGHHRLFDQIGACGTHPQFRHLSDPPAGYQILPSESGRALYSLEELRLLWTDFSTACLASGASEEALSHFLDTRPLELQKDIGCEDVDFVFYPSVPLHMGQRPWVIEIEDSTTLFFPFLENGKTSSIKNIQSTGFYPIIKTLVEQDSCKAIITHVKSTADSISILFDKEVMSPKVFHIPMGIAAPSWQKVTSEKNREPLSPKFLISNSWHQSPGNFYLRGGLESVKAFAEIKADFPNAELVIRAKLPPDLPEMFHDIIEKCDIRVIDEFLPADEWEALKLSMNFFLIPSARIHIVSMLEAMAYGMILVASDGWAIDEYATDGLDAVLVQGRKKVSHVDSSSGILSEDYSSMYRVDSEIVQEIVTKVTSLILNPKQQDAVRLEARKAIDEKYSIEKFNTRLREILDYV